MTTPAPTPDTSSLPVITLTPEAVAALREIYSWLLARRAVRLAAAAGEAAV